MPLKPIWVGYLVVKGLNQDWQNFRIFRMGWFSFC